MLAESTLDAFQVSWRHATAGIVLSEELARPKLQHPAFPFTTGASRAVFVDFFTCLGTTNSSLSEPCIDRATCELLSNCLEMSVDSCDEAVSLTGFRLSVTAVCDSEATLIAKMRSFLSTLRGMGQEETAEPGKPARRDAPVDLGRGIWAYKCVFPMVIESWTRVWLTTRDGRLLWHLPNHRKPQGSVPLSQVLDARLTAMVQTKAPRTVSKNGLRLRLTGGANPVFLAICTETMAAAQTLVAAVREAVGHKEESPDRFTRGEKLLSSPKATVSGESIDVHVLRSGQHRWTKTSWKVAGDVVEHTESGSINVPTRFRFPINAVNEVDTAADLSSLSPPTRGTMAKHCTFVLRFADCDLFCCVERPKDRETLLGQLRVALLRGRLLRAHGSPLKTKTPVKVDLPGSTPMKKHVSTVTIPMGASRSPSYNAMRSHSPQ